MNAVLTVGCITLAIMILLLSSVSPFSVNQAKAQSLTSCPIGYQRNTFGTCEPVSNLQTCPDGYQRSASGLCVPVVSSQTCPVRYQQIPPGICVPVTSSQFVNPYGYPTTAATSLSDKNQTLSMSSSFTGGLLQNSTEQNSTNSSLPVNDSNATNQTRNQQQLLQPPSQSYPYAPPSILQPQPFVQSQPQLAIPPHSSSPQIPYNPIPMNPPASPSYSIPYNPLLIQPTKTPPRILSDNNYVDSYNTLHIVGEVINESFESMRFVKVTATFYDSSNGVIGTDFTYASPSTLQPGQRSPFDMTISERSMPTYLIAYYTLSVSNLDLS